MPFENVWDKDSRSKLCGYFKPYCWGLQGVIDGKYAMDIDGNSNLEIGLRIASEERESARINAKTYSDFVTYCGQYAVMPCESFSSVSDNPFSGESLDTWENKLKMDDSYNFHSDGNLIETTDENNNLIVSFKTNEKIRDEGGIFNKDFYDYINSCPRNSNEHPHGCIRRWFAPRYLTDAATGKKYIPKGLYSITYDPVGIDKSNKEITLKHSHNSIAVWENPHYSNGFKSKMVMTYYGRPERLEEADRICLLMAIYYNCEGNVWAEVNRGETITNFTKWKALKYLAKDPKFLWDKTTVGKEEGGYGIVLTDGNTKLEAIRMLREYLYECIGKDINNQDILGMHGIYDHVTILELKKWSSSGNFDRVSQLLIRAIEWKAKDIKATKIVDDIKRNVSESRNSILNRDWY